ncbi:regulator of chromosome condensation 1/beta-lactamase-inhibitor protein II [Schizophyllum commune]
MGPDYLGEFDKPKKNAWVEEGIEDGKFGEEGAGIESVASGGLHSVFVDERGTVWTCGVNDDAALGRVTQNVPNPEKPNEFLDVDELTSYPHPIQSLVDEGFRAVKVVAGDSINAALSDAGELRLWGSFRANEGSLGFSKALKHQFNPVPVTMDLINKPGDYEKIASVACGGNHILALTTYGNIFTWGAGEQCQLGRKVLEGRKIDGTTPRKIKVGKRNNAPVLIGAGMYHSFAVTEKGDVYGWGLNTMGQTGTGYYRPSDSEVVLPKPVIGLHPDDLDGARVIKIVGGEHHTLFLTSDGRVFACGRSNVGQLGLPDDHEAFQDREDSDFVDVPVQVPMPDEHDDDPVVDISCGPHSNMAVTRDGALYSWGQGTQGELGVPDVEVRTPRQIVRREGGSWAAVTVACGGQHTIGLFRKKQK